MNNFEIKFVSLFQYALFNKYFKNEKVIYEFGAGTGHNLLRLREINKKAKLYSFEWTNSGVKLINSVADFLNDNYLKGIKFDNLSVEGSDSKYTVSIISNVFEGKSTIQRHKMIYALLDGYIKTGEIHALTIKALTLDESEN